MFEKFHIVFTAVVCFASIAKGHPHDAMFTNSLDLTNDAPTITQLMDHIRVLEIDSRNQRVDFDTLKKEKQTTDIEVEGLKQELMTMKQEKQTSDAEMAGMKQELEDLAKESKLKDATIKAMENEIRHNRGNITGLGHTTDSLTNQLTTMHTELTSSYSAVSTSLNNTRHIETGMFNCGNLSPGANKDVTTKFSSPYTGAPPTIYFSVGEFSIRVTTDTSKYTALWGSLGHVDMEGFTYTCSTGSLSSFVFEQEMQWISFPTVL